MSIRTKRWTRSPRGQIFGVVTGLAEWRGLPVDTTRLIVLLISLFTAIFPAIAIYLILAVVLPEQMPSDVISSDEWRREGYNDDIFFSSRKKKNYSYSRDAEDVSFKETKDSDLEKEYENLKKKVETMENDVFDKEKDWDNRFNADEK